MAGVKACRRTWAVDGSRSRVDHQLAAISNRCIALARILIRIECANEQIGGALGIGQMPGPLDGRVGRCDLLDEDAVLVVSEEAEPRRLLLEIAGRVLEAARGRRMVSRVLGPNEELRAISKSRNPNCWMNFNGFDCHWFLFARRETQSS